MNKDRYQSTSARRALALLNSPQVCHRLPLATDDTKSYQKLFNLKHLFSATFVADGYRRYRRQPLGINRGYRRENSERTKRESLNFQPQGPVYNHEIGVFFF